MDVEIIFQGGENNFFPFTHPSHCRPGRGHFSFYEDRDLIAKLLESSQKEQESACALTLNQFQKHSLIWYE